MNGTNYEVPHSPFKINKLKGNQCKNNNKNSHGAFSTPHSHPSWVQIFASGYCFQILLAWIYIDIYICIHTVSILDCVHEDVGRDLETWMCLYLTERPVPADRGILQLAKFPMEFNYTAWTSSHANRSVWLKFYYSRICRFHNIEGEIHNYLLRYCFTMIGRARSQNGIR